MLMRGQAQTMGQLALEARVTGSYFTRILRLSFLAPSLTKGDSAKPPSSRAHRQAPRERDPASGRLERTASAARDRVILYSLGTD